MMTKRIVLGLMLAGTAAHAQDTPPMVTDRPTQAESPLVVPPGLVQVEVGGLHDVSADGTARLTSLLSGVARVGVLPRLELRAGFLGWQRASADGQDALTGFDDLTAGIKFNLYEGTGLVPSVALSGTMLVPVGTSEFQAAGIDPVIRAALGHDLGGGFSVGYNVGAAWVKTAEGAATESSGLYQLAVGKALGRLWLFVEGYGMAALSDGAASWQAVDAGATWTLAHNVQLDASGGVGLSAAASDWFVGLGVAFRVPR